MRLLVVQTALFVICLQTAWLYRCGFKFSVSSNPKKLNKDTSGMSLIFERSKCMVYEWRSIKRNRVEIDCTFFCNSFELNLQKGVWSEVLNQRIIYNVSDYLNLLLEIEFLSYSETKRIAKCQLELWVAASLCQTDVAGSTRAAAMHRINDAAACGLPHCSAKLIAAPADAGRAAATRPACIPT